MEDHDDIPLSALEHYSYCPRQFGLIHIERVWNDSVMTIQGDRLHNRADEASVRHERGREVWRAVTVWSRELRLFGRADVVEVLDDGSLMPVEYKRGKRRTNIHERVQLCAQAVCLEEMLGKSVPQGALYHAASRRLTIVELDQHLRETQRIAREVRLCFEAGSLPSAEFNQRCEDCSLLEPCLPMAEARGAQRRTGDLFSIAQTDGWVEVE